MHPPTHTHTRTQTHLYTHAYTQIHTYIHTQGMVIAFPIAISSGSKWKGWTFGALAGMAEPIGALVVSLLGIDLKSL